MKRLIVATALVLSLTGCGVHGMTTDEIRELAEARDACNAAGGVFAQWQTDFGTRYRCDFDQREDDR
jgi:hypothetical protein